jgi:hypothetical protein
MGRSKKYVAPVAVAVCISFYSVVTGIVLWQFNIPITAKIMVLAVSVTTIIILVVVLVERIKEINKGEEDDLGKY